MSWIAKAENLLNKIDQSAAVVLQQKDEVPSSNPVAPTFVEQKSLPRNSSAKNIMTLSKSTPKKATKNDLDERWESMSETMSRRSSVSSKHDQSTVIDQSEKSVQLKGSSSNASLNSFSVEKELSATKILASELRSENNELKFELDGLMEQVKANGNSTKVQELENVCAILTEEKRELTKISQSLESSNSNYVKTISEFETTVMKLQQAENDLKQKLDYAKNETRDSNNELQQYRLRAQNQLQLKEKLIEQLKNGGEITNGEDQDKSEIELDQLRNQRDHLQSELTLLTRRFDESRNFIEKMEHKQRMMQSDAEDKLMLLDETINQLNLKSSRYEDEIRLQKQEISQVRDEMLKQKTAMTTKLHDKENELKRLKNSYRESHMQVELENRMTSLTQSLLSKQNNLESITAERNALKFQLEKLSHQHEEVIVQMRHQRPQIITMNETDDAKSQVPHFMMLNPFDSRMSRRVKRAYSNLDQVGVRIAVSLRRFPLARIFSVFYVALLHFFVMFVLLSSSPSQ